MGFLCYVCLHFVSGCLNCISVLNVKLVLTVLNTNTSFYETYEYLIKFLHNMSSPCDFLTSLSYLLSGMLKSPLLIIYKMCENKYYV